MMKPNKQQRDLGVKLMFATQYLIDIIDGLSFTTYHNKNIRSKAKNLSKELELTYGGEIKTLFNWNSEIVSEININFERFWNHVLEMNPAEISDLVNLLDKARVQKTQQNGKH